MAILEISENSAAKAYAAEHTKKEQEEMATQFVWVFNNPKGRFAGGVFTSVESAEEWIVRNHLTGVLTQYPLDIGSYEWANEQGFVSDKLATKATPDFIGSFSSASFEHRHYADGRRE